jgi:hypothetical protein
MPERASHLDGVRKNEEKRNRADLCSAALVPAGRLDATQ